VGLFYEIFGSGRKKRCEICGCHLMPDSEDTICEVCVDELLGSDPGEDYD
jgi:hypothetical protein